MGLVVSLLLILGLRDAFVFVVWRGGEFARLQSLDDVLLYFFTLVSLE